MLSFTGELRCEPLAGVTTGELRSPIRITLTGSEARYERAVRMPAGHGNGIERGTGALDPAGGGLHLNGEATGRGWSYAARFGGRLLGREIGLLGRQEWKFGEAEARRGCTISAVRR